ncbi:MAG TPA: twin-arginine translocase TatA/TatE family subunit [Kofleriaceae bacterium]|nr:twin-arginine translocase TatA/TatE family subunit [Kofleriaceae bacterium]
MFGIGGSEIIVILVVALLFLGPDKLPDAAKTISKGIRDLKKQQRALQQQIENDEQIGGAIRDLKSALRGEPEAPKRPPVRKEPPKEVTEAALETPTIMPPGHDAEGNLLPDAHDENAGHDPDDPGVPDRLKLPPTAGEPDLDVAGGKSEGDEDLANLIKPATGGVAKASKTDG